MMYVGLRAVYLSLLLVLICVILVERGLDTSPGGTWAKTLILPSGVTGVASGDVSTMANDASFDSESRPATGLPGNSSAPGLSPSFQHRHPRFFPPIHENLRFNYKPPTQRCGWGRYHPRTPTISLTPSPSAMSTHRRRRMSRFMNNCAHSANHQKTSKGSANIASLQAITMIFSGG